ncbi:arginine--tRNA ligase [Kibdelosporangium philippinense]|uniref:Arginine--tRNA ligase n=1 Tax=Kibdelosporangium philippinense TaxID=211113 RepID=A0ABS8ZYU9_9PSEU|nr:arginine--tRNA ligase [Kibdelosporangium philippinense]MCE7011367.1 arginine--tRNA ligase [Kibdelosporangium philippinense]
MLHGDVGLELAARVAAAVKSSLDLDITLAEALIRPSSRPGADYQCNAAMGLAKKLGRPPREVAAAIVQALDGTDLIVEPEIAGPGFINLTLTDTWLTTQMEGLFSDPRLGVKATDTPRRIAIDYSSPNVAKEMHVGHVRSTIIGDALVRLLRFNGDEVIPHNHLGDWGTPFGMLIEHLIDEGFSAEHSISDLNTFYQEARKKFDADPDFAERARLRVVELQGGDEETLRLWHELVNESMRHFMKVYQTMGIGLTPEDNYGESFYNPFLADTVDELEKKGLTEISDGAVCVFPKGFVNREGDPLPLIVRKSDGGYGYMSTDLATVRYWTGERGATDLVYVVGTPQSQHFAMVFAASRDAGWLGAEHTAVHVNFGSILGEDGKMFRTRAGGSIKLSDLLDEAIHKAAELVRSRSELDEADQAKVAHAVGIGAIKYADLSNDREKDYTFSWERMLATDGNTAAYLQYANARNLSIIRKSGQTVEPGTKVILAEQAERDLAVQLLQLPAAIQAAIDGYTPHKLATYLYETSTTFTAFFEKCPVLKAESEELRASRLVLCALTSKVLTLGLDLLGIEAPTRL